MVKRRVSIGPRKDLLDSTGLPQKEGPFVEEAVVTEDVLPTVFGQYLVVVESDGFPTLYLNKLKPLHRMGISRRAGAWLSEMGSRPIILHGLGKPLFYLLNPPLIGGMGGEEFRRRFFPLLCGHPLPRIRGL